MDRRSYVYTITLAGVVRYVGKGANKRIAAHLYTARGDTKSVKFRTNPRLYYAIRKNLDTFSIDRVRIDLTNDEACELERAMIAERGRIIDGGTLYNLTLGGEGTPGRVASLEARAKMSARMRNRVISAETIARMSAANRGRTASDETRAKMSATKLGKAHSTEARANMSAARCGVSMGPLSAEHRAKIGAALRGKVVSAETSAKISAAKRGKPRKGSGPPTAEHRAKISAAHLGKTISAETRAKISAALRARHADNQPDLFT